MRLTRRVASSVLWGLLVLGHVSPSERRLLWQIGLCLSVLLELALGYRSRRIRAVGVATSVSTIASFVLQYQGFSKASLPMLVVLFGLVLVTP